MKYKMKYLVRVIAFFLGLACSISTQAQEDSTRALTKKLEAYYNNTLQEKLFLHTDRSFYLTGETLWLKIYNVDAALNRPLSLSKVAYVEIIDKDKNAILQTKIAMDG